MLNLELGMTKTGFNSDLMLMSLNLYSELNCVKKGVQLLRDIDIKSIQYDSMGYVCFPHFVRLDRGKSKRFLCCMEYAWCNDF